MKITVEVIHNLKQRYPTVGDWQWEKDHLTVRVSEMRDSDWKGEMAVAIHEIVEALICKQNGVTEAEVDAFDMSFSVAACEPGDHPDCPYRHEHAIATAIERLMVEALGLNWAKYEGELLRLSVQHEQRKLPVSRSVERRLRSQRSMAASEEIHEKTR